MVPVSKTRQIKEFLVYCGCGTVSTVADAAVYFPLVNSTSMPAPICVLLGTSFATFVAFLLMKPFVFHSKSWSKEILLPELTRFVTTRIAAILLEVLFSFITVTLIGLDENIMRVIGWLAVAIGNYLCAKYIVFKYLKIL